MFGKLIPCPDCASRGGADVNQLLAGTRVPEAARAWTLSKMVDDPGSREMLAEVARMIEAPYGMLTIWGEAGGGKTVALEVAVNSAAERGLVARYYRMSDLLDELRGGFEPNAAASECQLYWDVCRVQLLALDELDKVRLTPYAQEVMFRLIDDRYIAGRPDAGDERRHTLISMNRDPATLPAYLYSRLRWGANTPDGFRIVHNTTADMREPGL